MRGFGGEALALARRYTENGGPLKFVAGLLCDGEFNFISWDAEDGLQPAERAWVFELGSITKTVTAGLLCKLLAAGKITLDTPVSDYFDDLPGGYHYPTVEQLATHTAGYGEKLPLSREQAARLGPSVHADHLRQNPYQHVTPGDVATFVRRARLTKETYPPVYSNLGIAVLGQMLAAADGLDGSQSAAQLAAFIEDDLGLEGLYTERPPHAVEGRDAAGEACGNWLWGGGPFLCVGGLYAAARPALAFAARQLTAEPGYLTLAHAPRAPHFEAGHRTGLCWFVAEDGIRWHNGGTGCFKTYLGFDQPKNAAAVVLANRKERAGVTPEDIGFAILRGL